MAESRTFRIRFWIQSTVFLGILVCILVVLSFVGDNVSRYKLDLTQDGVYTISKHFENILRNLKDDIYVTYYTSEKMPSMLLNLRRDTVDMFDEIRVLSGGRIRFKVIDLEGEAKDVARQKVEEYRKAEAENREPEEPEPRMTRQELFMGRQRQQKTPQEIKEERRKLANNLASKTERDFDDVYYELLHKEWYDQYLNDKKEQGIQPISFQDRRGSDFQMISFYSAIEIEYQEKDSEIIPFFYQLQNLELEMATAVLRLTNEVKPKVAFFDGRAPEVPPFDPMNPRQNMPRSDYGAVQDYLGKLFDLRGVTLKEGDSLDDLRQKLLDDAKQSREDRGDSMEGVEADARIACFVVAQPDNLEERQIYEISKAVSEGIPTIFLVSRHSIAVENGMQSGYPIEFLHPTLDDYFESLGINLGNDLLASNSCSNLKALINFGGMRLPTAYPFSVTVMATAAEKLLNDQAALTNRIPELVFPATNGMTVNQSKLEKLGLTVDKLAWTHDETWSVQVLPFSTGPFNRGQPTNLFQHQPDLVDRKRPAEDYADEFIERRELALLLRGKFPFFYQEKEIPEWKKEEKEGESDEAGPVGSGGPAGPQEVAEEGSDSEAAGGDTPSTDQAGEEEAKPEEKPKGNVTPKGGRVLIVASADAVKDRYLVGLGQGFTDYRTNLEFFQNTIETFGLGDDLLNIRRKMLTQRHFEDATEDKRVRIQVLNFAAIPVIIALFGVVRFLMRRREANAYERQQQQAGETAA